MTPGRNCSASTPQLFLIPSCSSLPWVPCCAGVWCPSSRGRKESLSKGPKRQMPYLVSLPHATLQPVSQVTPWPFSCLPFQTLVLLPFGDSTFLGTGRIFRACPAWACHMTEKKRVSERWSNRVWPFSFTNAQADWSLPSCPLPLPVSVRSQEAMPDGTLKKRSWETSLIVQWLRLPTPDAGGLGSIPGQGTRSHTLWLSSHTRQQKSCVLQLRPGAAKKLN